MAEMKHIFPPELGFSNGMNFVKPEQLEEIVEGLIRLGYLEHDLQAILGGNLMRVAKHSNIGLTIIKIAALEILLMQASTTAKHNPNG